MEIRTSTDDTGIEFGDQSCQLSHHITAAVIPMWRLRGKVDELLEEIHAAEASIHAAVRSCRLTLSEVREVEIFKAQNQQVVVCLKHELAHIHPSYNDISALYDVGLRYLGRLDAIVKHFTTH